MATVRPAFLITQTVFWAATAFTLVEAFIPPTDALHLFPWDKALHFTAFYMLTFVAAAAYPRRPLCLIGTALSMLGALIELIQGIPVVHRDSDF